MIFMGLNTLNLNSTKLKSENIWPSKAQWLRDTEVTDLLHPPTPGPRRCCRHSRSLTWFWSSSHSCFRYLVSTRWRQTRVLEHTANEHTVTCAPTTAATFLPFFGFLFLVTTVSLSLTVPPNSHKYNVAKSKLKLFREYFERLTTTSENFVLWLYVSQTRFKVVFWPCTVIKVNLKDAFVIDAAEWILMWAMVFLASSLFPKVVTAVQSEHSGENRSEFVQCYMKLKTDCEGQSSKQIDK